MTITIYIIGGVIVVGIFAFVGIYNALVRRKNQAEEAWADIEVQLKRRYDLIPNVVEAVKGYAGHEKGVFENVTKARTAAMGVTGMGAGEHAQAENMLAGTLKTLFAVAENYPDLKANMNFLELQRELSDTENKIQSSRRFFNGNVRDYNISLESFPSNIIAGMFGFARKELFDLPDASPAQNPVAVKF
ncbi:MAG: LemA family protein [Candidatus Sungiibacteriota bacterium]